LQNGTVNALTTEPYFYCDYLKIPPMLYATATIGRQVRLQVTPCLHHRGYDYTSQTQITNSWMTARIVSLEEKVSIVLQIPKPIDGC